MPELPQLVADAERSYDIAQLDAQAKAANRYVEAVEAGGKPQLSWSGHGGVSNENRRRARLPGAYNGVNKSGSFAVGLSRQRAAAHALA